MIPPYGQNIVYGNYAPYYYGNYYQYNTAQMSQGNQIMWGQYYNYYGNTQQTTRPIVNSLFKTNAGVSYTGNLNVNNTVDISNKSQVLNKSNVIIKNNKNYKS